MFFTLSGRRLRYGSNVHTRLVLEPLEDRWVPSAFNLSGTTLSVSGTSGDDHFQFAQKKSVFGPFISTAYTLTMNSESYTFVNGFSDEFGSENPTVTQVIVNGDGGNDAAAFITNDTYQRSGVGPIQETSETAMLVGGGALLYIDDPRFTVAFVQLVGFNNIYAYMGHADAAYLIGTAGVQNTFVSAGSYSYMTAPGSFHYVTGAANVFGYAVGASDIAYHYDGSGPSSFVASGTAYSLMTGTDNGQSFMNEAIGFTFNSGIARHGSDLAFFYDSPRTDFFVGDTARSTMSAANADGSVAELDTATGFATVFAYSFVGGIDYASVPDTTHNVVVGFVLSQARNA